MEENIFNSFAGQCYLFDIILFYYESIFKVKQIVLCSF